MPRCPQKKLLTAFSLQTAFQRKQSSVEMFSDRFWYLWYDRSVPIQFRMVSLYMEAAKTILSGSQANPSSREVMLAKSMSMSSLGHACSFSQSSQSTKSITPNRMPMIQAKYPITFHWGAPCISCRTRKALRELVRILNPWNMVSINRASYLCIPSDMYGIAAPQKGFPASPLLLSMTVFQAGKLSVERPQTAPKSLKYVHVISLYDIIMLAITVAFDSGFGQNRTMNLLSICLNHSRLIFTRDGQIWSLCGMQHMPLGQILLASRGLRTEKCCKTWARSFGQFLPPQTRYISAQPPRSVEPCSTGPGWMNPLAKTSGFL